MKKIRSYSYLLSFLSIALMTINLTFTKNVQAVENCSEVVEVGHCWSGFQAVIVEMANGDKLWLGNYNDSQTRLRTALAMQAKATGEPVCYQGDPAVSICSVNRSYAEWFNLGGSLW